MLSAAMNLLSHVFDEIKCMLRGVYPEWKYGDPSLRSG